MKKSLLLFSLFFILFTNISNAGWQVQNSGTTVNLYSIVGSHFDLNNKAWACGDNGVILYTSNGGVNWVQQNSGTTNKLYGIAWYGVGSTPLVCVGENGLILRTTNEGATWTPVFSPVTSTLRYLSDHGFMICGDNGVILRSDDLGVSWVEKESTVKKQLNGISDKFNIIAVGENGTIVRGNVFGNGWEQFNTGVTNDFYAVAMFNSFLMTMGEGGVIRRSTTNGTSWFSMPSPTTKTIKSFQFSTSNTSRAYAVGDNGLVMKSTNNMQSWGLQVSNTNENLNKTFFFLDDMNGWICGDNGVILRTTDGGGQIFPTEVTNISTEIPDRFELKQNYPNPFNPATTIVFDVPSNVNGQRSNVNLNIYDISGKLISELVSTELNPGEYSITFNAKGFSSGIYFYTLSAGNFKETKRMMLVK